MNPSSETNHFGIVNEENLTLISDEILELDWDDCFQVKLYEDGHIKLLVVSRPLESESSYSEEGPECPDEFVGDKNHWPILDRNDSSMQVLNFKRNHKKGDTWYIVSVLQGLSTNSRWLHCVNFRNTIERNGLSNRSGGRR